MIYGWTLQPPRNVTKETFICSYVVLKRLCNLIHSALLYFKVSFYFYYIYVEETLELQQPYNQNLLYVYRNYTSSQFHLCYFSAKLKNNYTLVWKWHNFMRWFFMVQLIFGIFFAVPSRCCSKDHKSISY